MIAALCQRALSAIGDVIARIQMLIAAKGR